MKILELFCDVDDFWQQHSQSWKQRLLANGKQVRHHCDEMHPSEIMTILIHFHQSCYRTFKHYYLHYVQVALRQEFPRLLSYTRMVEVMADYLVPLTVYLHTKMGVCTGISFIDSTALAVCKNPRITTHRVFAGLAQRGKTTTGWFFGFKLHLVINDRGELLAFCLTPGNRDDRTPVPRLARSLFGKLIADKGYLSQPLRDICLSHCLSASSVIRVCNSSRVYGKTWRMHFWTGATNVCSANAPSLNRSMTSSRTSARSSTPAIGVPPIFSSTWLVG